MCLLFAVQPPIVLFAPLLLLSGFCDAGFRPGNMRLVLEPCSQEQRPTAQGIMRVGTNLGLGLGGVCAGLLATFGYRWVFAVQGLTSLAGMAWMALAYRHQGKNAPVRPQSKAGEDGASPWTDSAFWLFIAGQLTALVVFDQIYSTLGLFLRETYHLGPQWLGYLFTLNCCMVVCLQIPLARRVSRIGLSRCSHLGVACIGLSFLLLELSPSILWAAAAMAVLTCGELLVSPTWSVLVMQRSEGRRRGQYLGIYNATWSGRTLFAPALGTWAYGRFGGLALWWICAGVCAMALMLLVPAVARMQQPDCHG